ncbi:MAG: hypothetical protein PHI35_09205 [Victivallaceae bacterium]|nr:hypothetical protein [Victivallaceae bacterium]
MDKKTASAVAADAEFDRLMNEPAQGKENAALELAVATGGNIEIAGRSFPAPAAAVYCLLEAIDSPFMPKDESDVERPVEDLDVFHALYLFAKREQAVAPILKVKRRSEQIERLENSLKDAMSPEVFIVIAEHRKNLADAQAAFDEAALDFGLKLGSFNIADAINDIQMYLSLAGGFDWLPQNNKEVKKNAAEM